MFIGESGTDFFAFQALLGDPARIAGLQRSDSGYTAIQPLIGQTC